MAKDRHGLVTSTFWMYVIEVLMYDGKVKKYSVARRRRSDDKVLSDALTIRGAREARIVSLSVNICGMTPTEFVRSARILSTKKVRI